MLSFEALKINNGRNMKYILTAAAAIFMSATVSMADQAEFCVGFSEGYKSIKGDMVIVPICPIAPITPIGSTDFREGIKAGMAATR
jgi:hypothetical protein